MNTHEMRQTPRSPAFTVLLLALVAALGAAAGAARSAQEHPGPGERRFENGVPGHVPLKVRLKDEAAFRNPKNDEWGRDLEIEVTNTGVKPIYYMFMIIELPDFTLEDGNPWGIRVKYGRKELWNLEEPILPEDVPIRPGESHTFRIPEQRWEGFKAVKARKNKAGPRKVRFVMQFITYGDGTGFEATEGAPTSRSPKRQSQGGPPPEPAAGVCQPQRQPPPVTSAAFLKTSSPARPADFLRVNLYPPKFDHLTPRPRPGEAPNGSRRAVGFQTGRWRGAGGPSRHPEPAAV